MPEQNDRYPNFNLSGYRWRIRAAMVWLEIPKETLEAMPNRILTNHEVVYDKIAAYLRFLDRLSQDERGKIT